MILGCFVAGVIFNCQFSIRFLYFILCGILGLIPHLESEYDDLDNADQERYDQSIQSLVINIENHNL